VNYYGVFGNHRNSGNLEFRPLTLTYSSSFADISHGITRPKRRRMIQLTRLNGNQVVVNSDLIEFIEETPDTVITLTTNDKLVVRERMADIVSKVVSYRRQLAGLVEERIEHRLARA